MTWFEATFVLVALYFSCAWHRVIQRWSAYLDGGFYPCRVRCAAGVGPKGGGRGGGGRRRSAALSMRTGITDANDDDAPDDLRHEWFLDERSLGDGAVLETHPPPRERFRRLKVKP